MYIHSNKEIDKKVNVSKIANNINTMGDDSTEVQPRYLLEQYKIQPKTPVKTFVNVHIIS